ncbi:MAG: hypothetical protein HC835_18970 [Oscillatoriales cyanobacterium RM2_1_1]|nr:hypothetical protein [Oscillatoriales cyanobacterium SM2_3_0]NJO47514.1 hypothetical protein [Oscillatoriales cyanobacterium RM2_1_1]
MKLTNPLYYPASLFIGGTLLVLGVRFLKIPNLIILPGAIAATLISAAALKAQEPNAQKTAQQQLEQEIQTLKISGHNLAQKADTLRTEANQILAADAANFDLLVRVQEVCDRTLELPRKLETAAQRIPQRESLLSVNELHQQLLEVKTKIRSSAGTAQQQLEKLAASLARNIELAEAGKDTRQAQLVNLHTIVQDSAGTLQQLQNKLRTADLKNSQDIQELQRLSTELNQYQSHVDVLI